MIEVNLIKQNGFTLIELVVIVILGILSVTALPKYVDLSGGAHRASLDGMKGAILSANEMVYSKSIIYGVEDQPVIEGSKIGDEYTGSTLIYGKMQSDRTSLEMFIPDLKNEGDWVMVKNGDVNMRIHPADHPTINGEGDCFIQYSHQWTCAGGFTTYPAKVAYYTDDC